MGSLTDRTNRSKMSVSSSCEGDNPIDNIQISKDNGNLLDDTDKRLLTLLPSQVVVPRSITGPAHPMNKGAIDWYDECNLVTYYNL